jgi:hypothetical protein
MVTARRATTTMVNAQSDEVDDDGDGATGDDDVDDDGDGATGDDADDDGEGATGNDNDDDGDGMMGNDINDDGNGAALTMMATARGGTTTRTMATDVDG